MSGPLVLLTQDGMTKIAKSSAPGGDLHLSRSAVDEFYLVTKVEVSSGLKLPVGADKQFEALRRTADDYRGQWLANVAEEVHLHHLMLATRSDAAVPWEAFRELLPEAKDPRDGPIPLITHAPALSKEWIDAGVKPFAAWMVSREEVCAVSLEVEPDESGVWRLDPQWPVANLQERRVAVVGLGSIGGRVAEALAAYGVGTIDLVDPDRFMWHNQVRHVLGPESVGRSKVAAMKAMLDRRWPNSEVHAHEWNVVNDAHLVRGLLNDVDLLVCAADGIAPRRVVSHLARRANVPAIQACVLADGAVGEVTRYRPGRRYGCLMCHRADLLARGAIDLEADQELDYGTGVSHKPMTAVGPDLHLVAHVAAKAAVATILESLYGDERHRLPGEHAIIGLRPTAEFEPPFDVDAAASIVWHDIAPPRGDCATCAP